MLGRIAVAMLCARGMLSAVVVLTKHPALGGSCARLRMAMAQAILCGCGVVLCRVEHFGGGFAYASRRRWTCSAARGGVMMRV